MERHIVTFEPAESGCVRQIMSNLWRTLLMESCKVTLYVLALMYMVYWTLQSKYPEMPKSKDPFQDYDWLPEYESQYNNMCNAPFYSRPNVKEKCHFYVSPTSLLSVKVEIVSFDPMIILIHDLVTETEVTTIYEDSLNILETSEVLAGKDLQESKEDSSRVAQSGWLGKSNENVEKIKHRLEIHTGIDLIRAEEMNVIHYVPGGHYAPHFDALNVSEDLPHDDGDRTLTIIVFLNEPPDGGHTVFPKLELSIPPVRGSLLIWFNLLPLGTHDELTLHGGCPVWDGVKQIGTIWVRQKCNELGIQCPLDPQEDGGFGMHSFTQGFLKQIALRDLQ